MSIQSTVSIIIGITLVTAVGASQLQYIFAAIQNSAQLAGFEKAPAAITGENVYVVWWTDKGTPNTNGEVMFRASTDGGVTFGDKINLSNTTNADFS
jgi:hypothetical protein